MAALDYRATRCRSSAGAPSCFPMMTRAAPSAGPMVIVVELLKKFWFPPSSAAYGRMPPVGRDQPLTLACHTADASPLADLLTGLESRPRARSNLARGQI